ncbi:MAG: DUF1501 domain-containing protein [Planctomycetia bacterium]
MKPPPAGPADRLAITRRHFFAHCPIGVGALGLSSLLARSAAARPAPADPLAPRPPHFPARAKSVIFLFMAGGPSQLDLFEHKPDLTRLDGEFIPESFVAGKRFAFMDAMAKPKLLGTRYRFARHGRSGAWVSELLPHTAGIVDELTFLRGCRTDLFNHAPAKLFMNTGTGLFGRPSMGAWVTYGLGSECDDLPGFVVMLSGPRGPRGGGVNWGCGMLPSSYQGVPLRGGGDPILNLSMPAGVDDAGQRRVVDAVRALNLARLVETGDEEIAARISSYEMAYRMQSSAPELIDLRDETPETLQLYGIQDPAEASYARNCLLARRLVERGVRFIQLYDTSWDHHGSVTENLEAHLPAKCQDVDRASAALVLDLKRRGLLDDTIVVWGGEFGRTPMGEPRETTGRNHHIDAFTMWFAGGGFQPGASRGVTDEFGFNTVAGAAHVRDIHATLLHQLGLDHQRLTVRFQGLDVRLTGVEEAHVLTDILA